MDWAVCQTGHRPSVTDLLSLFWRVPFRRTGPVQFPLTAADLTHQQGVISSSLCLSVIANPSMQRQSRSCSFVKFPSRTMESVLGKLSFAAYLQSGGQGPFPDLKQQGTKIQPFSWRLCGLTRAPCPALPPRCNDSAL